MPFVTVDPDSKSLGEHFAIVKTPRKNRGRYPEACVTPVPAERDARAQADPARHLYPAVVYGPSSSSESQRVYYLVRWLDGDNVNCGSQ